MLSQEPESYVLQVLQRDLCSVGLQTMTESEVGDPHTAALINHILLSRVTTLLDSV